MSHLQTPPARMARRKNRAVHAADTAAPILINSAAAASSNFTITFNQPVLLSGIPAYTAGSAHAISATQTAPTVVVVTFSGSVISAGSLNVGYRDPAIRSRAGGYVTSTQFGLDV